MMNDGKKKKHDELFLKFSLHIEAFAIKLPHAYPKLPSIVRLTFFDDADAAAAV